jgi:hypothetical protein
VTQTVTVNLRERHAGQVAVIAEAQRFNVLMCGRRFGKTATGIDLAVEAMLDGERVGWFAPSYKLLNEAWRELVATLAPLPETEKSEQDKRLAIVTGGSIECWSLDSDDPARGRKYHKVIIDEAGLVPRLAHIWHTAIRPTLADYQGGAWFLGTPKGVGDFSALWAQGQGDGRDPEWASWRMPTHANPFIPPDEIDAMRRSMPDEVFRQDILGEPIDAGEQPSGRDAIAACVAPVSDGEPVIWGVDLARSVDFTVAIGLDRTGHVCHLERWRSDWGVTRTRLRGLLGSTLAYMDSTGVGDPIVEDLQRTGSRIVGVTFTARVKQQGVESLIAGIQQRQVRFPDGWLRGELDALTAERTAMGTRYTAPDGLHDDGVMALMLAWKGYQETVPAEKVPKHNDKPTHRVKAIVIRDGRAVPVSPEPRTITDLEQAMSRGQPGRLPSRGDRLPRRGR